MAGFLNIVNLIHDKSQDKTIFGEDNIPVEASDRWAVGATAFEMLSGDAPFGEERIYTA